MPSSSGKGFLAHKSLSFESILWLSCGRLPFTTSFCNFWIYFLCHVCGLIHCLHYFVFRVTPVVLSYAKTPTIPHAGTWAASCPGASSAPTPAYLASTRTYLNTFPGLRSRSSCTTMMMPSLKTCKGKNRR